MLDIDWKPYSVGRIGTATSIFNALLILICLIQIWSNSLQPDCLISFIQLPGIATEHLFDLAVLICSSRENKICSCLRIKAARFKLFPS